MNRRGPIRLPACSASRISTLWCSGPATDWVDVMPYDSISAAICPYWPPWYRVSGWMCGSHRPGITVMLRRIDELGRRRRRVGLVRPDRGDAIAGDDDVDVGLQRGVDAVPQRAGVHDRGRRRNRRRPLQVHRHVLGARAVGVDHAQLVGRLVEDRLRVAGPRGQVGDLGRDRLGRAGRRAVWR